MKKRSSLSSLSSGKASIQLSSKPPPTSTEIVDDDDSDGVPTRTISSLTEPITPGYQTPRSSNEKRPMSDYDIIADIIANATAAASSKSGTYSSLSSGKASIATTPKAADPLMVSSSSTSTISTSPSTTPQKNRRSTLNSFFGTASRSKSETTISTSPAVERPKSMSRSSLLFSSSSIFGGKKRSETEEERELKDAGVTVKEIKSTLGRLVIPKEIANPMPQVKLEVPQHARLNR